MSDPVTNVDIEDVLSSIRRLVTEGGSPATARTNPDPLVSALRGAATTPHPAPGAARPEARFVLTPAFRVADVPTAAKVPVDDLTVAARIMPREEALRALDGKPPAVGFDFSVSPTAKPAPVPDFSDDVGVAAPIDGRLRLSATVAGLEAAVTAQPDEWEPDGSEEVPVMDWSQAGPEDAPVFRSRNAVPFLLEQAVVEPTFRHAARFHSVDEADDLDGVSAFEAESGEEPDDELSAFLAEGYVMDEEALRRLIVEIVQQELQGSLGERITRNVRKLVRREISRIIASEEFK
jgi:hypothetical protein